MSKDERILKKVGKLLKLYGVNDEEKEKFLLDLQDKKYDDEEEVEEIVEEKDKVEGEEKEPTEPEKVPEKVEDQEKVAEGGEEEKVEGEKVDEKVEKEGDEEVVEKEEEKVEEEGQLPPPPAEKGEGEEGKGVEENQFDYKSKYDELQKANDGLSARVQALEDIIAKLGVEVKEDQTVGAQPNGNAVDETYNSAFDEINRKRVG